MNQTMGEATMTDDSPAEVGALQIDKLRHRSESNSRMIMPLANTDASISDYLTVLRAGRWLILGSVTIALVLALVLAWILPPVYRSDVVLAPVSEAPGALSSVLQDYGALASVAGLNLGMNESSKEEAIATLRSRALADRFIRDEGLMPVLFRDDWDSVGNRWMNDDPSNQPSTWDAYEMFDKEIRRVTEDRRSGLVTLSIDWYDPETAARWANKIVERVNNQLRERDIAEAETSIKYLQEQLEKTSVLGVRQGIYELLENQIKTITLARVREQYAFRIVDPAVPADPKRPIRPKRILMSAVALTGGLLIGIILAICRAAFRRTPKLAA